MVYADPSTDIGHEARPANCGSLTTVLLLADLILLVSNHECFNLITLRNCVDNRLPIAEHFAEDGMRAIKVWRWNVRDKKL